MKTRTIRITEPGDTLDNGATVLGAIGKGDRHPDDVGRNWWVLALADESVVMYVIWTYNAKDGGCSAGRRYKTNEEAWAAYWKL